MIDPIDPDHHAAREADTDADTDSTGGDDRPDASGTPPTRQRAPRPRRIPKARVERPRDTFTSTGYSPDPEHAALPFNTRTQQWFAARGWQPFDFQREVWRSVATGASGLLHATTGAGKTWAVWFGAMGGFGGRR